MTKSPKAKKPGRVRKGETRGLPPRQAGETLFPYNQRVIGEKRAIAKKVKESRQGKPSGKIGSKPAKPVAPVRKRASTSTVGRPARGNTGVSTPGRSSWATSKVNRGRTVSAARKATPVRKAVRRPVRKIR